jgi:predicted DsbA family dithiol-disulfide isomerase
LLHHADAFGKREALGERLFAAYLGEGAALSDPDTLVALATDAGLEADSSRTVLESDSYAEAVRADETEARELGVSGVPFFVLDRRFGVSGAQSPEVLRAALQQAWDAQTPFVELTPHDDADANCADGRCDIP